MVKGIVEWESGTYFIHSEEFGVSTMGKTLEKAKEKFVQILKEYPELCKESEVEVPEVLQGSYTVEYEYAISAFLQEAPITLAALSAVTGINQRQLSAYKNGVKTPREATSEKLIEGVRELGKSLLSVSLV